ncbi:MAG: [Thermoguttaceae bacterium]|nr:[FeFe] hydrogenase H-cluster radical SAM maturase HydE [Thermoguttaceae bacterium]
MLDADLSPQEIAAWLRETNEERLQTLWDAADRIRRERVGDAARLRGLVEISNRCARNCLYCGVRAERRVERYRMTQTEILECAKFAKKNGLATLVLQAGEDRTLDAGFVAETVRAIRDDFGLTITLSLGERTDSELVRWKEAGALRYLLRFETSNPALYAALHPDVDGAGLEGRISVLKRLREIGYEVGSGVMIGIPGQTFDDLTRDLALFRELDLDMIGSGPFLPHSETPLGALEIRDGYWETSSFQSENAAASRFTFRYPTSNDQVPNTNDLTFKVVALSRILCPDANIPSTTAVATLDGSGGRKSALSRGANVIMPNLTPTKYRRLYEIYPNKAATFEDAETTLQTALRQIAEIGRFPGVGPGSSKRFLARVADVSKRER